MSQIVSFPGLGLEFNINPIAFSIGPLSVSWYGILATAGILCGILYALKRSNEFGLNSDKLFDVMLYSIFAGIAGARIYYVAFSWDYYKDNLIDIFKVYEGGIAIYGGIIGGAIAAYFLCKHYKLEFLSVIDIAGTSLLIGQAIGRWGNFVNVEAFGSNTNLPWGMTSPSIERYLYSVQESLAQIGVMVNPKMPVHPTFFYESVWCFLGFLVLAWYTKKRRFNGELALIYAVWNGSGRFVIEAFRTDSLMIGSVRISQFLAGAAVIISAILLFSVKKRNAFVLQQSQILEQSQSQTGIKEEIPQNTNNIDKENDINGTVN